MPLDSIVMTPPFPLSLERNFKPAPFALTADDRDNRLFI